MVSALSNDHGDSLLSSIASQRGVLLLLALLTLLVFYRSLDYPLLQSWDDNLYVLNNTEKLKPEMANLKHWAISGCVGNYQPLTLYSYMLDYALWGTRARGYHLQNLAWHLLAVCLFFLCLIRLKARPFAAAIAAAVFAVHPQRVESVVWISERKDVLCAAFFLAAFLSWLQVETARNPKKWKTIAFLFYLAAMLAKSMAISFPLVILLYEWHRRRDRQWKPPLWAALPFLLTSLLFVPITILFQGKAIQPAQGVLHRIFVVWHNLFWYPYKLFFPFDLSPIYPTVFPTITSVLLLSFGSILLCFLLYAARNSDRFRFDLLPVLLAYAGILGPVSGVVALGAIDHSDRYSYLPSTCLLALAAIGLPVLCARWSSRIIRPGKGVLILLVILAAGLNIQYQVAFADSRALFAAGCRLSHPNPVAVGQLAEEELKRGNLKAVEQRAQQLAEYGRDTRRPKSNTTAYLLKAAYLQGAVLHHRGKYAAALKRFQRIYQMLPQDKEPSMLSYNSLLSMMGDCRKKLGQPQAALTLYDQLLQRNPRQFEAYINRGVIYFQQQQFERAAADFRQALALHPQSMLARHNLQQALQQAKKAPQKTN